MKALIGPTGYGTYGIRWREHEPMERRGGYSGPYNSADEAEKSAREWAKFWDEPLVIEAVENVNAPELLS